MEICKDVRKKVGRKFIQIVIVFVAAALTAYVLMRDIDKQSIQPLQNYSSLCTFMHIAVRNSIVFFLLSNILISEKRIARMTAWLFVLINGIIVGALAAHFPTAAYFVLLIPHGIPEMSAYFLLIGTVSVYRTTWDGPKYELAKPIGILYAILLGSAWIEAYVTPYLAIQWLL